MKTVPLRGPKAAGRVALVDDEDYELVARYRWTVMEHDPAAPGRRSHGPYAISDMRRGRRKIGEVVWMHHLITGSRGIDHADGDGLNNQRSNLRPASRGQYAANSRKNPGRSSKYKGVSWDRQRSRWAVFIMIDGKKFGLGRFTDEEDAALTYDVAARDAFGEFARTNFQEDPTPAVLASLRARRQASRMASMDQGRRKNAAFRLQWWQERGPATHTCVICGAEFQSTAMRVFYCGKACKWVAYQRKREREQEGRLF